MVNTRVCGGDLFTEVVPKFAVLTGALMGTWRFGPCNGCGWSAAPCRIWNMISLSSDQHIVFSLNRLLLFFTLIIHLASIVFYFYGMDIEGW